MLSENQKNRLGFASYDFSNSGYVAVFQSFLFPLFLNSNGEQLGISNNTLWALVIALSSITAVILAPFVGRLADQIGKSTVFVITVVVTALLAAITPPFFAGFTLALAASFVLFNLFFELSQSLYDSFLLNVERSDTRITSLSSFAWGFGYLGGALFAGLYFGLTYVHVPIAWMLTTFSVLYLVLSLPAIKTFNKITNQPSSESGQLSWPEILSPKSPVPWRDLIIYWAIADCVAAVMYFAPLYMNQELALGEKTIGALLLGGQLLAFPLTIVMGGLANRIGRLRTIQLGLAIWAVCIFGLAFAQSLTHVVIVIFGLAFVVGSTQAILRSHFAARVSTEQSGEGLGFFAIAQKSASVFSPVLMAGAAALTGSLRGSFAALGILLVVAAWAATFLPESPRKS